MIFPLPATDEPWEDCEAVSISPVATLNSAESVASAT